MRLFYGLAVFFLAFLFLSSAWSAPSTCPDVTDRGYVTVLTVNLLFSEVEERNLRLARIANFVQQEAQQGNPIDVILLQEAAGGILEDTSNSSVDLRTLLLERSLNYNLRYVMANGISRLLSVGNSILTRCSIKSASSITLPVESEEIFGDLQIPLRRKALVVRIDVPGFGKINVYDIHLCASCSGSERLQQAQVLMRFITALERMLRGDNPLILGGDFNTDLNVPDNVPVYNLVIGAGFVDTYATEGCTVCCTPPSDLSGCTFALPGNPYAVDPFTNEPEAPARIDYIFTKGFGPVLESQVVFKGDSLWVSDHSGVLSRVTLP
jgi:maltose 6'-phosphate phosphatase